ncbi:MAG: hypothetical protein JW715_08395 [Sedimentisphaerales bacterium]|nr:hypothetical protein [Sedimentisphaerales bacterium]
MELSWTMKLRIAAAAAVGIVFVGILAWPWGSPPDPFGSVLFKAIDTSGIVTLLIMAFLAGLIAYFAAWPYGWEIGVLAVPFGLCVWAVRAGKVAALMQLNATVTQRQTLFASLRWEPIFWLMVVAAGFAGVVLGQKIRPGRKYEHMQEKNVASSYKYSNPLIALIISVLIVQFCIKIIAQDVVLSDNRLGSVVAQPAIGQIVFAVSVSFGLAAFVVKKYLNVNYIWSVMSIFIITAVSIIRYTKLDLMDYLIGRWPSVFFSNVVISILPVQMVAFGTIGSIAGYWMAVRYVYWRKHELQ